ncbi:hypothetical protein BGW42_003588, partial [Actinomortierella wolfii]
KFPNTWLELVHVPVILGATGMMPPASPYHFYNWILIGFIFQFIVRRYRTEWYMRFNYVLSAALDSATAIFGLVLFFGFSMHGVKFPNWWGNPKVDHCPLDGSATNPYIPPESASE